MKAFPAFLLFAVAVPTVASMTKAAGGDAKADLQVKYNIFAKAFADQDPKPFDDLLAKDYVLHVGAKNTSRANVLADFKRQMASMHNVKWVRTVTHVSTTKTNYVATVKSVFDGDFENGGKTSHFWNTAVSLDTWIVDRSKNWKLTESRLIMLDAKVDGKPAGHFPPPRMGKKPNNP